MKRLLVLALLLVGCTTVAGATVTPGPPTPTPVPTAVGLSSDCVKTLRPLYDALNEYIKANTRWADCFAQTGCTTDSIISQLRAFWTSAHDDLATLATAFSQ